MKRTFLALLIFAIAFVGISYSPLAQQKSGETVLDILCAGKSATEDEVIAQKEGYTYELNKGQRHPGEKVWFAMGENLTFTLKGLKAEEKYVLILDSPMLTARKLAVNVYINNVLVLENWLGVETPIILKPEWYEGGDIKVALEPKGPGAVIKHIRLVSAQDEETIKKILTELKSESREVKEEAKEKPKEEVVEVTPGAIMKEVIIVPTTHMDIEYTMTPEDSLNKYDQYIMEAINLIEKNERLRYNIEHSHVVEHFLRSHPEYKDRLKKLIQEGKIEVMANWTNPHFADLSGEHVVRQIAYTQYWLKKNFGVMSIAGKNGELSMPTLQLGQILSKSGVRFYQSIKLNNFPMPTPIGNNFAMFGLDGSGVLFNEDPYSLTNSCGLYNYPDGKDNLFRKFTLPKQVADYPAGTKVSFYEFITKNTQGDQLLWMDGGKGWDDQFPDLEAIDRFVQGWNKNDAEKYNLKFRIGTFKDFYNELSKDVNNGSLKLPKAIGHTEAGELLYYGWGWTKYRDRAYVENKLLDAEKLSSILYSLGLSGYPEEKINKAWENIMGISTHNWGFKDANNLFPAMAAGARKTTDEVLKEKMGSLAGSINYTRKGKAVVVFNPLNWERSDVVRVKLESSLTGNVFVTDAGGKKTLSQVISPGKDEIAFIAEKVPSVGYKTYYIVESKDKISDTSKVGGPSTDIKAGNNTIENRYYRIKADKAKGITSVYDKLNERELFIGSLGDIRTTALETLGMERYFKEKGAVSPEIIKALESLESQMIVEDAKVTGTGPVAATITVRGKALGSNITVQVSLFAGINRVDLQVAATPLQFKDIIENLKTKMSPTDYNFFRNDWAKEGIIFYLSLRFNLSGKATSRAAIPYGSITLDRVMPWKSETKETTFSRRTAGAEGWVGYFNVNEVYAQRSLLPNEAVISGKLAKAGWMDVYDNDEYGITYAMEDAFNQLIRDKDKFNIFYKSLFQNSSEGHTYRLSFRGHKGNWKKANSPRFGDEISHPLLVAVTRSEGGPARKGKLPEERSFIKIGPENIILTTLKKSFTDEGVVARFYDAYDMDTQVRAKIDLHTSPEKQMVIRTDMNDMDISGPITPKNGEYVIQINSSGIETIKINGKK